MNNQARFLMQDALPQRTAEDTRYFASMPDGGPVYSESHPEWMIVEPWNAVSSLFILLPAVYWAIRLRGQFSNYRFLTYCIPLLFLGGAGSTLFHAFRAYSFFLWMDVLPTAILMVSLSIYFWVKVLKKWWFVFLIILPMVALRWAVFLMVSPHTAINISYALSGAMLFVPIILLLRNIRYRYAGIIGISIGVFALALFFREMDAWQEHLFPMGTHFLWHVFTGIGGFFLSYFLLKLRNLEMDTAKGAL